MKENLFINKYDKEFKNNESVFYSKNQNLDREVITETIDIRKKLNDIFNAPDFVYKADVKITLKDKTITKTVIAKNHSSLITLDNETIKISDILDIKKVVK